MSLFHPGLQPSLHTPVTGIHFSCLQLLHVFQEFRPYFPREHANNNQHLLIETTNIVDKRGYNGLGLKLLSPSGPSITHSKRFIFSNVTVGSWIREITKLPNSEQSYKGKVKTLMYINRKNQSTTGKLWKPQWPLLGTGISKEIVGWIRF